MGAVEATVEIVTALIWPGVVVLVLVAWRRELLRLVPRLEEVSGGPTGFTMRFREEVKAAADAARRADAKSDASANHDEHSLWSELQEMARSQPLAAILASWIEVEHAAADALGGNGLTQRSVTNVRQAAVQLGRAGRFDDELIALAQRLADIRNRAVHVGPATADTDTALMFLNASGVLRDAFIQSIPARE